MHDSCQQLLEVVVWIGSDISRLASHRESCTEWPTDACNTHLHRESDEWAERYGTVAAYISTESSSFSPVLNGCAAPRLHAVLVLQRANYTHSIEAGIGILHRYRTEVNDSLHALESIMLLTYIITGTIQQLKMGIYDQKNKRKSGSLQKREREIKESKKEKKEGGRENVAITGSPGTSTRSSAHTLAGRGRLRDP